jgi:hypothetical protein
VKNREMDAGRSGVGSLDNRDALEELGGALDLLASSLVRLGTGAADRQEVLKRIFTVNNVIGRMSRLDPSLRQDLYAMQSKVNLITVSVKSRGDIALAPESLREASEILETLRGGPGPRARKIL